MRLPNTIRRTVIRGSYVVFGLTVLVLLFRDVDLHSVSHAVIGIGYSFVGITAIYFFGCVFDVLAWQRLIAISAHRVPFFRLLAIHIAGESYYRFIPAGVVIGDGMKIFLGRRHFHISSAHLVSSLVLRKLLMGLAQVFYIGLAVLAGIAFHGSRIPGSLEIVGGALAVGLFLLFFSMGYWIRKGTLCSSLFSLLMKLPSKKLRGSLATEEHVFTDTDALLRNALRNHRPDVLLSTLFFSLNWMTELVETVVILVSLGAALSLTDVMLFEPVVSLVRSIAFILPGGLGVMDAGYVSALRSFGIANAAVIAAAFIVVKRSKELVWIVIGLTATTVLSGNAASAQTEQIPPDAAANTI